MNMKKERQNTDLEPLFRLYTAKGLSMDLPHVIPGKFVFKKESFCFQPSPESGIAAVSLRVGAGEDADAAKKLAPLFVHLTLKELPMEVMGCFNKDEGVYTVSGMQYKPVREHIRPRSPWKVSDDEELELVSEVDEMKAKKFSPEFWRLIVRKLKNADTPPKFHAAPALPPMLRDMEQIETYNAVCGGSFPPWLTEAVNRELENVEIGGTEGKHAREALRYLVNIDWSAKNLHVPEVKEARAILDAEFDGMETVKERILEIIAQIRQTGEFPKWGILLNGPAGVGKTSIAMAFAKLLNEPMIRIDGSTLGASAEEVSGSSRVYSNARPGRIVERMLSARSKTGVLLINEIDKVFRDTKDTSQKASDVLLTLLDRMGFYDNFLDTAIPTDGLFSIATCNDKDKLSAPLLDRFEVIDLPAYSREEKRSILLGYTLPRAFSHRSLTPGQVSFTDDAVDTLIRDYALEPGVRDLEKYSERFAGAFCKMREENGPDYRHVFTGESVRSLLGPPNRIKRSFAVNPGEINSVFYHNGEAHLFLMEASVVPGSGKFAILGPVSELQKDYIRVAYECIRNTIRCDLSMKDVSVFIPHAIPMSLDNHIGCAAYAAIGTLILHSSLDIRDIAFIGGVDLNGNLYYDGTDIRPLLRTLREADIKTLYAPVGVSEMISSCSDASCDVTVVEARDAQSLLSMALAASSLY